jgi:TPR repeat protein
LEIVNFQRLLDASQAARSRNSSIPSSDEECAQTYIALLKSFDAPSWEIARKEAAQSSAANIEQQRQMREAQQRASDEVAAEQARQQKEAKDAAAQADSERRQRAAAAEQARNEALLADMRDKAERGDGESQYEMGTYYDTKHVMNVLGTSAPPKNDKQAADWYTKAAAQGHLPSRVMLCHMYYDGRGVPEDHTKAESFCGNSSQQDQDILEYRFKDLLQKAEEGDTKAQGEVGVRYYEGNAIPGRDFAKAVYWIQKAADKGDPVAQQNLGIMYLNGFGVPHDSARALTWYRKAANQDFAVAQSNLGFIYLNGTGGTPKDVAEAANWLEKAAKLGLPLPQEAVAELYEEGRGVPQDDAKAEDWYLKAAQQGNENAKYRYEALRKVMLYKRYIKSINDTFMTPKDASDICVLGAKFQDRKIVMANELVAMLAQDDAVVRIDFSTPGLFSRSYKIDVVYITTKPGQLKTIFLREVMVDRPTGEVYKNPAEAAQATDVQKCLAITKIEGVNREDTLIGNDLQAAVAAQVIVSQLGARLFARAQSADQ